MKEFEKIVRYRRMGDSDMYDCAEVGDIVRCKDCKYAKTAQSVLSGTISWCDVWSDKYYHSEGNDPIEPNDYCSYGERRGE